MAEGEARTLFETPTWAVATVVTVMILISLMIEHSLEKLAAWLEKTKRNALLAALEKVKDELMLFGFLSLLMGHWTEFMSTICVNSSAFSSKFHPCVTSDDKLKWTRLKWTERSSINGAVYLNDSVRVLKEGFTCPKGKERFASRETLEQLHRLIFVLGVTHIFYSFATVALALVKIYSWRSWENHSKEISNDVGDVSRNARMRHLTTFISDHTSHPWSQHRVLVWLLCFIRQFWSSITEADYMALRLGFITSHQLPLNYDFLSYILRNMEEEFCHILGISGLLWIYAISCILLDFHGTTIYFYLSFLPTIIILLMGTKLRRVVVKLAVEIMHKCQLNDSHQFKLRDELFWFKRPRLLLRLIQLVSFQNALEMASFLWSLWEIKDSSCFMKNRHFLVIRLTFGVVSQFCGSFITFPLYVIVTQMGSSFRRAIVSERVRDSLSDWKKRIKSKPGDSSPQAPKLRSSISLDRLSTAGGQKFFRVMEGLNLRKHAGRGQSGTPREREDHKLKVVG